MGRCQYIAALAISFFLIACSNTRKIPAGDALYLGAKVSVKDDSLTYKKRKELREDLASLARPRPNSKFLGMRIKLFFYNLAGNPKREKSFAGWIKYKLGEPPVLLSDVNLDRNTKLLQNSLENR